MTKKEVVIPITSELKETLEVFRTERLEEIRKKLERGHCDEVREAFTTNYQMFKSATYKQLIEMYISFHQTMKKDQERGIRRNKSAESRLLKQLIWHRDYVDETLREIGGRRFSRDAFDAKSTNQVVRDYMDQVKGILENGDKKDAIEWLDEGMKAEWLK